MPFFVVSFSSIFPGQGCKRMHFVQSRLSQHVNGGYFVGSARFSVKFYVLEYTFHRFFSMIVCNLEGKILEPGKKRIFVDTPQKRFKSSTPSRYY